MTPEHMKTTPEDIDLDRMKDDTISRQAVLKLLSTIPAEEAITKAMLIQSVKQMDAAQPSGPDNLVKDSPGLVKDLVNDCISRKAAIERATKDHDFYKGATTPADMARRDELLNVMCWLGELPSAQPYTDEEIRRIQELEQAQFEKMYELGYQEGRVAQPERQKGEWIDYTEDGYVECPFCHNATNCDGNKDELHFCFSCGADMREDDYETD